MLSDVRAVIRGCQAPLPQRADEPGPTEALGFLLRPPLLRGSFEKVPSRAKGSFRGSFKGSFQGSFKGSSKGSLN